MALMYFRIFLMPPLLSLRIGSSLSARFVCYSQSVWPRSECYIHVSAAIWLPCTLRVSGRRSSRCFFSAKLSTPIDVLLPPAVETVLNVGSLDIWHFGEYGNHNGSHGIDLSIGLQWIEADILDIDAYLGLVQNLKASQNLECRSSKSRQFWDK